jgi:hypothetical protein
MNSGELNELLIKLNLVKLKMLGGHFTFNGTPVLVNQVGFTEDYNESKELLNIDFRNRISIKEIERLAQLCNISKASLRYKSDVKINNEGYSLKSFEAANPAIINHTSRVGFLVACENSNADIAPLDEMVNEYWSLRKQGIIKEDISIADRNSPFAKNKEYLKPILNYFLFEGSGRGPSEMPSRYLLDFHNPVDTATWRILSRDNAVDSVWSKLVFSIRSKGMPPKYPNIIRRKEVEPWTEFHQQKYRGSLHIRVAK